MPTRVYKTMNSTDAILTVPEVAADLRCSKAQVYKLIRGEVVGVSQLPSIPIGRRRVVRRSALERWKRANETGSALHDMLPESSVVSAAGRIKEEFDA
jgi:excisionase family DNA binding protein